MQDLDRLLADLAAEPPTAPSAEFEGQVFRRLASVRRGQVAAMRQLPISAAIVAGALGLGLALGGAASDRSLGEEGVLSLTGQLAPSTLLVGR